MRTVLWVSQIRRLEMFVETFGKLLEVSISSADLVYVLFNLQWLSSMAEIVLKSKKVRLFEDLGWRASSGHFIL